MAGTLTISTLSDGTNSTSSTNCIQGSAKAWVVFNTTLSIAASYNVSSITTTTLSGNTAYVINFTNAMADANYAISGSCIGNTTAYYPTLPTSSSGAATASSFSIQIRGVDTSVYTCNRVSLAVFR